LNDLVDVLARNLALSRQRCLRAPVHKDGVRNLELLRIQIANCSATRERICRNATKAAHDLPPNFSLPLNT
jgi:hypothetical protein